MRWMAILPLLFLTACASGGAGNDYAVDVMFRDAGGGDSDTLKLTTPALVSDMNGVFTIHQVAYHPRSALADNGGLVAGTNTVLGVEFTDHGDITVLRTDDVRLSFRAELGPEGKVLRALLGSTDGRVTDGFVTWNNDAFVSGEWELIYDGPELVVGRVDIRFKKYRVQGNFRAPRVR